MIIKKVFFVVVLISIVCLTLPDCKAQLFAAGTNALSDAKTDRIERHPSLGTELSRSAKLKIFVRRTEYRVNDILLLEIGMWAKNSEAIYLPTDMNADLKVEDGSGNEKRVKGYYPSDYFNSSFVLSKNALIYRTYRVVVGCKKSDDDDSEQFVPESDDPQFLFENNFFQTIPEGCIDVAAHQRIKLTVELENDKVVLSKDRVIAKTAVGTIRSDAVFIDIVP